MKKLKRLSRYILALTITLLIVSSVLPTALATNSESSSVPESSGVASETSSVPAESSNPPVESESLPSTDSSDSPESSSIPPESGSLPLDDSDSVPDAPIPSEQPEPPVENEIEEDEISEAAAFIPLAVSNFTTTTEVEYGQNVILSVELNRTDVNVSYQWQMDLSQQKRETERIIHPSEEETL